MTSVRNIILSVILLGLTATMVVAQTGVATVERQITDQGYEVIYSELTWLGRLRVLAVRGDYLREVVVGPGTGEVLRDVMYEIPGLAKALAKARMGSDGKRIVDLDAIWGSVGASSGPQTPLALTRSPDASVAGQNPNEDGDPSDPDGTSGDVDQGPIAGD